MQSVITGLSVSAARCSRPLWGQRQLLYFHLSPSVILQAPMTPHSLHCVCTAWSTVAKCHRTRISVTVIKEAVDEKSYMNRHLEKHTRGPNVFIFLFLLHLILSGDKRPYGTFSFCLRPWRWECVRVLQVISKVHPRCNKAFRAQPSLTLRNIKAGWENEKETNWKLAGKYWMFWKLKTV